WTDIFVHALKSRNPPSCSQMPTASNSTSYVRTFLDELPAASGYITGNSKPAKPIGSKSGAARSATVPSMFDGCPKWTLTSRTCLVVVHSTSMTLAA
ncbi:unnamed protein product, partial [Allacma fusca]